MIAKTEKDPITDGYKFKLCYVEEISSTYNDYDEETKAMMETPEYLEYKRLKDIWYKEWFKEHHSMSGTDMENWDREHGYRWRYNWKDYPTPEYEAGFTHYLYFTDNMEKQWGDDWDDAPYEYNADIPYDDKTNVLRIAVKLDPTDKGELYLPKDYGFNGNSHFSVDMINAGAIPWIFIYIPKYKGIGNSLSIMAGDTVFKVFDKLNNFKIKNYE